MDAMGGMPAAPGLWQEARNADGRVYYYNVQTKQTQWAKPFELMTPIERALANQPWKEYTAEGGRKYWPNTPKDHLQPAQLSLQVEPAPFLPIRIATATNTIEVAQTDAADMVPLIPMERLLLLHWVLSRQNQSTARLKKQKTRS
ncbi:hypothetical protein VTN02DRAFT_3336 [Thermoascus thermophilus]